MSDGTLNLAENMRQKLGTVVSAWFPESMPQPEMLGYLRVTLADVELYSRPRNVLLVVDGCPHAEEAAQQAADEVGERRGEACRVLAHSENQGKGGSVATGLAALLDEGEVEYFVARDCDGDHDSHDAVRLFRRALRVQEREQTDNLFVVGSRPSPHMSLSWARAEYELLLNEATVEACNARLAREGRWVDLCYSLPDARYQDFQSGYKLYTRRTARANIESITAAHDRQPEAEVKWWGAEFVTVTDLLLGGAVPAEVSRLSYDLQPQTTFDERDRVHAFGRQFVWLFCHLQTPSQIVRRITDNAVARSPLRTATEIGDELVSFREYIRSAVYPDADWGQPPLRGELL
jgi:hypothetical protein